MACPTSNREFPRWARPPVHERRHDRVFAPDRPWDRLIDLWNGDLEQAEEIIHHRFALHRIPPNGSRSGGREGCPGCVDLVGSPFAKRVEPRGFPDAPSPRDVGVPERLPVQVARSLLGTRTRSASATEFAIALKLQSAASERGRRARRGPKRRPLPGSGAMRGCEPARFRRSRESTKRRLPTSGLGTSRFSSFATS